MEHKCSACGMLMFRLWNVDVPALEHECSRVGTLMFPYGYVDAPARERTITYIPKWISLICLDTYLLY